MSTAEYYNRVNPDLLALIPPDAKVVLEIGCGAGALCEAYRRINPGVEWIGFEINRDAAKLAEEHCNQVFKQDVETDLCGFEYDEHDCVILGDVLEHLRDPWRILGEIAIRAKAGAQVLACIPNVQHWTVIRDLLAGHWRYTDEGLLDRTHLRFFTLESIREMFEQAGLQVFEIRGRDLCNEGFDDFRELTYDFRHGGQTEFEQLKEWRAYQYIVRAVKPPETQLRRRGDTSSKPTIVWSYPKLHIHAIGDGTCCERVRLHEPLAMLGTIPGVTCTVRTFGDMSSYPPPPSPHQEIVIQQRKRSINWEIQGEAAERWLMIAELDDDPEALEGMSDDDYAPLRAVHAIQCSTKQVAETCRQWNPNVMVFENQIADLPPWEDRTRSLHVDVFYGAQNRESDWAPIMPAINRILADEPVRTFFKVVHDRAFYDALETDRKDFRPFCDYAEYRRILRSCDIALLPLEDTRFNRHKSDLKFLECAAEGVVTLCSTIVYEETLWNVVDHTECSGGCCYSELLSFESILRFLIDEPEGRHQRAKAAYAYVRDHRLLSAHYRKRHAWYLELINARSALHAQLLDRCPELVPAGASSTTAS